MRVSEVNKYGNTKHLFLCELEFMSKSKYISESAKATFRRKPYGSKADFIKEREGAKDE